MRPSPPPLTPLRILTHSHSAALHSHSPGTPLRSLSSESHKTPGRSSDPSGVRSAHLSPRNLQDCPYHSIRHPAISHIKSQPQVPPSKDIPKSQTHQNRIHIPWHLSVLSCIIRLRNSTHITARHLSKGSQQFLAAIPYCRPRSAPAASRHLRNIIQPLLCDCPSGLPSGRGSAHTAHNPDYVKYLPPPPSRKWTRTEPLYLRTRVSTFSKERAECRPRHPPIWLSAITRCVSGQRLQPLPTTGAHRLRLPPLQSPPHQPHHTRNCLSCGHADSVQSRLKCST